MQPQLKEYSHRQKVAQVNRQVKLEINLPAVKLVSEQVKSFLKIATACLVRDAKRVAQGFKHAAFPFVRTIRSFVVGATNALISAS